MSGGQIAALIFALMLLLPGGCFLIMGLGMTFDAHPDAIERSIGPAALIAALIILSLTGLLFWVAFRRRGPAGAPPPADRG